MQAPPGNNPHGSVTSRFSKIALYSLLCFSLAGLVAGFAFGGLLGNHPGKSTSTPGSFTVNTPPIAAHSPTRTVTQGPENVELGEPVIGGRDYTSPEKADGTTSYTLSVQVVNKTNNTPITATDVTCRLWLTDDPNATAAALSANGYAIPRSIQSFSQPFPHEVAGALNFAPPNQQTQSCAGNGKTTWTYTVSPTVQHRTYYLAVLADWQGKHYNWYMVAIKVQSGNNARQ